MIVFNVEKKNKMSLTLFLNKLKCLNLSAMYTNTGKWSNLKAKIFEFIFYT